MGRSSRGGVGGRAGNRATTRTGISGPGGRPHCASHAPATSHGRFLRAPPRKFCGAGTRPRRGALARARPRVSGSPSVQCHHEPGDTPANYAERRPRRAARAAAWRRSRCLRSRRSTRQVAEQVCGGAPPSVPVRLGRRKGAPHSTQSARFATVMPPVVIASEAVGVPSEFVRRSSLVSASRKSTGEIGLLAHLEVAGHGPGKGSGPALDVRTGSGPGRGGASQTSTNSMESRSPLKARLPGRPGNTRTARTHSARKRRRASSSVKACQS